MTVVVITLAVALVAAMGVIVWLVRRGDVRVDQVLSKSEELNSAHKDATDKTLVAERALFEKEKAEQALRDEEARSDALEDFISADAKETDPNADLAPDDVAGRVLRFASKSKRTRNVPDTAGTDSQVPAEPGPVLHPEEGTTASGTINVPGSK